MANFNMAIIKTLAHEGGSKVSNDKVDKGGLTKYGISQKAYPHLKIRELTEEQARRIYRADYWNKILGDRISSQVIAENIFDTCVNMGVHVGSKLAQEVISAKKKDGIIGPRSLVKINEISEALFISYYTLYKISRYATICNRDKTQKKFLLGWLNRSLHNVTST